MEILLYCVFIGSPLSPDATPTVFPPLFVVSISTSHTFTLFISLAEALVLHLVLFVFHVPAPFKNGFLRSMWCIFLGSRKANF